MKCINFKMNLYKKDIKKIGNTILQDDGYTCFICNGDTYNLESILLREILIVIGNFEIIKEEDFFWENNDLIDIKITTNLPWEFYNEI